MKMKTVAAAGLLALVATHARAGEISLRVLTFNIAALPAPFVTEPWRFRAIGEELGRRRAEGSAPQLVALQEAFHPRVNELVLASGYPYVVRGPGPAGLRIGSGLMILSEFPIRAERSLIYHRCTSWNCFSRKGALRAEVLVPGLPAPLGFVTTHLNSSPVSPDFWTPEEATRRVRLSQARELTAWMGDAGGPEIFAGDFNFKRTDEDYEWFLRESGLGLSNAPEECAWNPGCAGNASAALESSRAIDHQFVGPGSGPGISVEVLEYARVFAEPVDGVPLSDHPGVEVLYRFAW